MFIIQEEEKEPFDILHSKEIIKDTLLQRIIKLSQISKSNQFRPKLRFLLPSQNPNLITGSETFLLELPRWPSGKESACLAGVTGSISGLGRSPEERTGNPLQYSCLGNPMDRGAWWATVHGVTESDLTQHKCTFLLRHPMICMPLAAKSKNPNMLTTSVFLVVTSLARLVVGVRSQALTS